MKKTLFLVLLFVPIVLNAQSLRFSLLGEPQLSWMVPDKKDITSKGALFGINAGLGIDYFFAENYAFSTGISINNIGGKLEYPDTLNFTTSDGKLSVPAGNEITYKLQYINIPLGLKFKTNEIGYTTFSANLGVTPMINIRDRASDKSESLDNADISEDIMLFNLNYFINIGVQYSLGGSTAVFGGIGYSSGFADVTSRSLDKITISTFSLRLGILF